MNRPETPASGETTATNLNTLVTLLGVAVAVFPVSIQLSPAPVQTKVDVAISLLPLLLRLPIALLAVAAIACAYIAFMRRLHGGPRTFRAVYPPRRGSLRLLGSVVAAGIWSWSAFLVPALLFEGAVGWILTAIVPATLLVLQMLRHDGLDSAVPSQMLVMLLVYACSFAAL